MLGLLLPGIIKWLLLVVVDGQAAAATSGDVNKALDLVGSSFCFFDLSLVASHGFVVIISHLCLLLGNGIVAFGHPVEVENASVFTKRNHSDGHYLVWDVSCAWFASCLF